MLCRAAQSVAVPGATPTVSLREASQAARVRSSQKSLARCSAQGAVAAESEAPALSKLAPGSASSWPALGSACKEISLCFRRRASSCCWRKAHVASWRSPSGVRSKMHATRQHLLGTLLSPGLSLALLRQCASLALVLPTQSGHSGALLLQCVHRHGSRAWRRPPRKEKASRCREGCWAQMHRLASGPPLAHRLRMSSVRAPHTRQVA